MSVADHAIHRPAGGVSLCTTSGGPRARRERNAIPYDVEGVELSHDGPLCSFDAFLQKYALTDPALHELAVIVRGADTDHLDIAPQAAGLLAISLGLSQLFPMITSCSPAGSSSTMRCTYGSSTPRGSVIPGTRSAPPPPSDVQGHSDRTLAPAVPSDSAEADYFRVKVWRRLLRIGAVPVKNSVWVLPYNDQAVEDFRWLLQEIEAGVGRGLCAEGISWTA